MYKLTIILAAAALTIAAAPLSDADVIQVAEQAVANKLSDPESARFNGVFVHRSQTSAASSTVCGFVNAKNQYGGYAGRKPFRVLMVDSIVVDVGFRRESDNPDYSQAFARVFANFWNQDCGTPFAE